MHKVGPVTFVNKVCPRILAFVFALLVPCFAGAVPLTGTLAKDYSTGTVTFDLRMGSASAHYSVAGATSVEARSACLGLCTENRIHFDGVSAQWMGTPLLNEGTIGAFPRERRMASRLMGFTLTGSLIQGMLNERMDHAGLIFDGQESGGALDYHTWAGAYVPEGDLRFGEYPIRGFRGEDHRALDLDYTAGGGIYYVDLGFGTLRVRGTINFTDTVEEKYRRVCIDADQRVPRDCYTETYHEVVATSGAVDLSVTVGSRGALRLRGPSHGRETTHEVAARGFLAWLEMVSYDILGR